MSSEHRKAAHRWQRLNPAVTMLLKWVPLGALVRAENVASPEIVGSITVRGTPHAQMEFVAAGTGCVHHTEGFGTGHVLPRPQTIWAGGVQSGERVGFPTVVQSPRNSLWWRRVLKCIGAVLATLLFLDDLLGLAEGAPERYEKAKELLKKLVDFFGW